MSWTKKSVTAQLANVYVAMLQRGIVIEKLSVFSIIIKELGISERYFRKAINEARDRILGKGK